MIFDKIETENILYSWLSFMRSIIITQYYDCLDDNPGNVSNTQYYYTGYWLLAVVAVAHSQY